MKSQVGFRIQQSVKLRFSLLGARYIHGLQRERKEVLSADFDGKDSDLQNEPPFHLSRHSS